jgi:hypothetical protein
MTQPRRHMTHLHEMAQVINAVEPRFKSRPAAHGWFRSQPVPGFGGQTALQMVWAGRAGEVLEYIAALNAGVPA